MPASTCGSLASGSKDGPAHARFAEQLSARLMEALEGRTARVGVIGLGYVGLPLVELFATGGFPVLGLDIDCAKVEHLEAGRSYIGHITSERVAAIRAMGRFEATSDFSRLADVDVVLICVPTPLGKHREPDLTAVRETGRAIGRHLRPGQLVVLESTTYPGTTRDVLRPELEAGGLVAGRDFFLAYSPEREDPGNPRFTAGNIPKVVGGWDEASGVLARALYGAVIPQVVPVSGCEAAEACKILENTYRAVNIALVNELKEVFDRMGVDIWEVIDAAKTKPFGFQAFYPGPGLGGHCLAGSETARVRGPGLDTVLRLADLFERSRGGAAPLQLGDVEVLELPGLETLSIDQETGEAGWKAVSHLFRRKFRGTMLEIRLAGDCTIRTTDRHPMLVVSVDRLEVREARDLKAGDLVPVFDGVFSAAEQGLADLRGDSALNPEVTPLVGTPPLGMGLDPRRRGDGSSRRPASPRNTPRPMSPMSGKPGEGPGLLVEATRPRASIARTTRTYSRGRSRAVVGVTPSPGDELVYSLEVPGTNTFATTGGVFVHNCIPIDPFYLTWAARRHGLHTRFIELAGEINTAMPHRVIDRVIDALNDRGKALRGSRVLVLGAAYKRDVDDCRESPAVELMEMLEDRGADVSYSDPHVKVLPPMRNHDIRLESVTLTDEVLGAQDCVLIATDHSAFDWKFIVRHSLLVVDTRGVTRGLSTGSGRGDTIVKA